MFGRFIDGNYLKTNIINHMSQLNQFRFSLCSTMFNWNEMNSPLTEDIQYTFIDFPKNDVVCYVDYFPELKKLSLVNRKSQNYYKQHQRITEK